MTKQKRFVLWVLIINTGLLVYLSLTSQTIQAIGTAVFIEIVQLIMLVRKKDPFELPRKAGGQAPYSTGFLTYAFFLGVTSLGLAVASFVWSINSTGWEVAVGAIAGLGCLFVAYGGLGGSWVIYKTRKSGMK